MESENYKPSKNPRDIRRDTALDPVQQENGGIDRRIMSNEPDEYVLSPIMKFFDQKIRFTTQHIQSCLKLNNVWEVRKRLQTFVDLGILEKTGENEWVTLDYKSPASPGFLSEIMEFLHSQKKKKFTTQDIKSCLKLNNLLEVRELLHKFVDLGILEKTGENKWVTLDYKSPASPGNKDIHTTPIPPPRLDNSPPNVETKGSGDQDDKE